MSDLSSRRRLGRVALGVVLAGAMLAAASCGQTTQTDGAPKVDDGLAGSGEPVSSAALDDPLRALYDFTFDDYVEGFRRYIDCTTERTAQAGLDAATMRWAAPDGEEWEQYLMIDWDCYNTHFHLVDVWRQTTRERRERQRELERRWANRNPIRHAGSGVLRDPSASTLRLAAIQSG